MMQQFKTDPDCEICRGRGIVQLPRHKRMAVAELPAEFTLELMDQMIATFACPQCAGSVDEDRVAVFYSHTDVPADIKDNPEHWHALVTKHAHSLVDLINKRQFIETKEMDTLRAPDYPGRNKIGLRSRIGVVSTARVASIEQRALAAAEKIVEEAVTAAIKEMWNWGSHYTNHTISKDAAERMVREGAKRVIDEHRERVRPNGSGEGKGSGADRRSDSTPAGG